MSQLKTKALEFSSVEEAKIATDAVTTAKIAADAVTGAKIRLDNNQFIRARNAANSADLNLFKVDTSDAVIWEQSINFATSGGPAVVQNSAATYLMEVKSIDTSAASTDSGAAELRSGNASGATSNSGDVGIYAGTATATRGDANVDGRNVNLDADANVVATGVVFDMSAMESLQIPQEAADPSGVTSKLYYNTTSNVLKYYDGASWITIGTGTGLVEEKETFVLAAGDITNQYIDLANVARTDSITFIVKGLGPLLEGASYDYSVSYTGGAGGNTRITFLNDIATGGAGPLVAGDVVQVKYSY